jgi:ribonuclease P protein component
MAYTNYSNANQTFKRIERLRCRNDVKELFVAGQFFFFSPFKVYHKNRANNIACLQVLIAVPRRNHKDAVVRNKIKRLVREAWRKHKGILTSQLDSINQPIQVGIIYTARAIPQYKEIETKIFLILQRLSKVYADR